MASGYDKTVYRDELSKVPDIGYVCNWRRMSLHYRNVFAENGYLRQYLKIVAPF
jgi:hypothetical protein